MTGITHTAIGPSQPQEAVCGYDVSFHGGSTSAALIQYKRAYVDGAVWTWKLNRTARQDQHKRLQLLESLGYPVFYAFPYFATPTDLVALRRRLLPATFWYPPSYVQPPGGPSGHHEVTYHVGTGKWQVSWPESVDLRPPVTIGAVVQAMEDQAQRQMSIEEFAATVNRGCWPLTSSFRRPGTNSRLNRTSQARVCC